MEVESGSGKVGASEFLAQMRAAGAWKREVGICGLIIRFGIVSAWNHCFISVEQAAPQKKIDWLAWVAPFLRKKGFIQAWLTDLDFDYWQNAQQPIQYELAGRDFGNLLLVSNGLPPPLDNMWIDISKNPGRRVIKDGYVEAVGDVMWIGAIFQAGIGGINIERLCVAGWNVGYHVGGEVITLTAPGAIFTEGASLDAQNKLRSAIYS